MLHPEMTPTVRDLLEKARRDNDVEKIKKWEQMLEWAIEMDREREEAIKRLESAKGLVY